MSKGLPILMLSILCDAALSEEIGTDQVSDILVDICKKRKTVEWQDGKVSSVIKRADIKHIVLLRAETSAPGAVDAVNILQVLGPGKEFIEPPTADWAPIYECVIITKKGKVFHLRIGRAFALLKSQDGYGVIKSP